MSVSSRAWCTASGPNDRPLKVVATGGLAPLLAEGTTVIGVIDPDLTLDGLRLLAERNPSPHIQPRQNAHH